MQGITVGVEKDVQIGGRNVKIPNTDLAKLSYYLNCINSCIPGCVDPRYIQFALSDHFTPEDGVVIVLLCSILSPDLLENKAIKEVPDEIVEKFAPDSRNTFVTITEKTTIALAEVTREHIAGLRMNHIEVASMMLYTKSWIQNSYHTPLGNYQKKIEKIRRQQEKEAEEIRRKLEKYEEEKRRKQRKEEEKQEKAERARLERERRRDLENPSSYYPLLSGGGGDGEGFSKWTGRWYIYIGVFLAIAVFGVYGFFYSLFTCRKKFLTTKHFVVVSLIGFFFQVVLWDIAMLMGWINVEVIFSE